MRVIAISIGHITFSHCFRKLVSNGEFQWYKDILINFIAVSRQESLIIISYLDVLKIWVDTDFIIEGSMTKVVVQIL